MGKLFFMKSLRLIGALSICFLLFSCGTTNKIEALKPLPTSENKVIVKNKTSFVALPVTISITEIQHQLNKNLKGLIYNDSIIKDDNVAMKIWKSSEIQLEEKNGNILSKIPLKILVKYKYGTDFLGLNDTREIKGVLKLSKTSKTCGLKSQVLSMALSISLAILLLKNRIAGFTT